MKPTSHNYGLRHMSEKPVNIHPKSGPPHTGVTILSWDTYGIIVTFTGGMQGPPTKQHTHFIPWNSLEFIEVV